MKKTGLRLALSGLLNWSRRTDRRRCKRVKKSMEENKHIQTVTIEVKID